MTEQYQIIDLLLIRIKQYTLLPNNELNTNTEVVWTIQRLTTSELIETFIYEKNESDFLLMLHSVTESKIYLISRSL